MKTKVPTPEAGYTDRGSRGSAAGLARQPKASALSDNRQTVTAQRRLHQLVTASPQGAQIRALQRKIDDSAIVRSTRDTIPTVTAQRMQSRDRNQASHGPIQLFKMGTGKTRIVTVTGKKGSKQFEECIDNEVDYDKGDKKVTGTPTSGDADWAKWLVNTSNKNNATRLHVVNKRWGGPGENNGKNIVPGTPTENSAHLHQGETEFDDLCFGGKNGTTAIQDALYQCHAEPSYDTTIDVTGGPVQVDDPNMAVYITTDKMQQFPIETGSEGLTFKDGSV